MASCAKIARPSIGRKFCNARSPERPSCGTAPLQPLQASRPPAAGPPSCLCTAPAALKRCYGASASCFRVWTPPPGLRPPPPLAAAAEPAAARSTAAAGLEAGKRAGQPSTWRPAQSRAFKWTSGATSPAHVSRSAAGWPLQGTSAAGCADCLTFGRSPLPLRIPAGCWVVSMTNLRLQGADIAAGSPDAAQRWLARCVAAPAPRPPSLPPAHPQPCMHVPPSTPSRQGKKRFDKALEQLEGRVEFSVVYHPFIIDHGTAPGGGEEPGRWGGERLHTGGAGGWRHCHQPMLDASPCCLYSPDSAEAAVLLRRRGVLGLQCAAVGLRRLVPRPAAQRQAGWRRVRKLEVVAREPAGAPVAAAGAGPGAGAAVQGAAAPQDVSAGCMQSSDGMHAGSGMD